MSSNAPGPRPRQVTVGGWVIAVASAMLVVTVFETMANLHSVDTRDAVLKTLTTGSVRDLGVSLTDALTVLRAALFVAGTAAAITGVLGIYVLQRHATARVVLTVAAVPVVLTAPFAGGVLGLLIGGSTALLWTRPARDWFAGRPVSVPQRQRPGAPARPAARTGGSAPPMLTLPPAPGAPAGPPPTPGWGQAGSPVPPPAYGAHPGWDPRPVDPRRSPADPSTALSGVPGPVRVACIVTGVFSALTGGIYLLLMVAIAVDRARILSLLRDNPSIRDTALGDDQLVAVLLAVSALIVVWCLAAVVLAALTWRRHRWAWALLQVSIATAALVEVLGFPYTIVHLAACGIAFGLLRRAQSRDWFRPGGPRPGGPAGPPPSWLPPAGPMPPDPPPQGKPPVW